jgi:hypothetical protein
MEKVIEILEAAREAAGDELKGKEEFQIRVNTTLTRLIDGLKHASSLPAEVANDTPGSQRLTHVLGKPIKLREPIRRARKETIPTTKELSDFELLVNQADVELETSTAAELKDKYGDLTLRGLALKLGMEVTPTEPAKINAEFIKQMKQVQKDAADKAAAVHDADEAAARVAATSAEDAARLAEEAMQASAQ